MNEALLSLLSTISLVHDQIAARVRSAQILHITRAGGHGRPHAVKSRKGYTKLKPNFRPATTALGDLRKESLFRRVGLRRLAEYARLEGRRFYADIFEFEREGASSAGLGDESRTKNTHCRTPLLLEITGSQRRGCETGQNYETRVAARLAAYQVERALHRSKLLQKKSARASWDSTLKDL